MCSSDLLHTSPQKLSPTKRDRIFIEEPSPLSQAEIEEKLALLSSVIESEKDGNIIKKALQSAVPTYQPK